MISTPPSFTTKSYPGVPAASEDPFTEELGRREFISAVKIAPGKRKELSIFVSSPPTRRISVYQLGKRERDGLLEQVIVVRVLYDDGTAWQAR